MSSTSYKKLVFVLILLILCWGMAAWPARAAQGEEITATATITPMMGTSPTATPIPPTHTPATPTGTPPTLTPTLAVTLSPTVTPSPSPTPTTGTPLPSFTATTSPSPSSTIPPTQTKTALPKNGDPGNCVPGEVLIKVDPSAALEEFAAYLEAVHARIASEIPELGTMKVESPGQNCETLAEELASLPGVLHAEPNYYTQVLETFPNDPRWGDQYGLAAINAPQGWDLATGSAAVTIAVLDTGVDQTHPDLSGKIVAGYDFIELDTDPQDDNGHGTHVAGIAAAATNNGTGVAGVSWGARIMPIKILNRYGNGSYSDLAAGIIWATDHGAHVINLSLGGAYPSTVLADAVDYAYGQGVVQVAASGNSGSGSVLYPARYPHVIAVGATDSANNRAGFSNYGAGLDLMGPGSAIFATTLGGGYGYRSGTSMSTPFVAGLAAILAGVPRPYSPDLIALEMASTALDLGDEGRDDFYGHGLIQVDAALRLAIPTATPTSTQEPTPTEEEEPTPGEEKEPAPQGEGVFYFTLTPSPTTTSTPTFTQPSNGPTPTYTEIPEEEKVVALELTTPTPTRTRTPGSPPVWESPASEETSGKPTVLVPILGVSMVILGSGLLGYWILLRKVNGDKGE